MPNRRRRKLSTTMSAVAALAVASPCAYFLVYESTAGTKPSEHYEFKQAANTPDLPGEVMGALSQGLSQFGINVPPVPALNGSGTSNPGLGTPSLDTPGLATPTSPGSPAGPLMPAPSAGINPALTNPALTSPTGATPGLTSPTGLSPGGMGPNEVPIAGLDPGADGTYPILGDTSGLGGMPATGSTGSSGGGLVQDVMNIANQLGAAQAIDLIKGMILPAIMQGAQNGGAAAPAVAPPVPAVPAATSIGPIA